MSTLKYLPLAVALVLVACGGGGGGGGSPAGPSTASGGIDLTNFVIESQQLIERPASVCFLRVRVRNLTPRLLSVSLIYRAFDAAGNEIGFTFAGLIGILVNGGSTAQGEGPFISGGGSIACSQIARFELVRAGSQFV